MPDEPQTLSLINMRIGESDFVVREYVTGGSFGWVHLGVNASTQEKVAIKLEKKEIAMPQLALELCYYRKLGPSNFIPTIYYFGAVLDCEALVMKLLGPSLAVMHIKCNRKFSIVSILNITIQLLHIYKHLHQQGVIYRDTKPENFLFGQPNGDEWSTLFLVDLGLCKSYIEESGKHIEMREGKAWMGTRRYLSINNHDRLEISRRDDLESLLYMVVFLHKGQLPWQGVQGANDLESYNRIADIKKSTSPAHLCSHMPAVFVEMLELARRMRFEQAVDFTYFSGQLHQLLLRLGITEGDDELLDFDNSHTPNNNIA